METSENNSSEHSTHTASQTTESTSSTTSPTSAVGEKKTLMAVLAYIGILILIPYFTTRENPFVKFHIKQGLVLIILELIVWFGNKMVGELGTVFDIINIAIFILAIIGIVHAVQGKEKELPIVGQFSKYFTV